MRLTVECVACVLALAAHGTCETSHSERKAATWLQSSFNNLAGWAHNFEQQRLDDASARPPVREFTATKIIETIVTESHPRITEAPLVRRKLGSNKWDLVHEGIQGRKRDATICPSDYQLCPQSLNGGCCPTDRVCGTDSCYPTSTGPAEACGTVGYMACGIDEGGGCCPTNYICGTIGCVPSAGVPNTETCSQGSYLCPASLSYGCCRSGMACGINDCYSTQVQSYTVFETFTKTSSGHVKTITSESIVRVTPTAPSVPNTVSAAGATLAKISSIPSAVDKVAATSPTTGGLTKPQIDGIIAGAVIIVLLILIVGFLILRRLNKVKQAIEASSKSHRSYRTWSQSYRSHKKSSKRPNMVATRSDPAVPPSDISKHVRHPSEPSPVHAMAHEMEASPSLNTFPFSPDLPSSPQFHHHQKYTSGYAPVATSEPSTPPLRDQASFPPGAPGSVGTIPPPDLRDQNLRFGHLSTTPPPESATRPQHGRQWSADSNTSGFSQGSSAISESDPGVDQSTRRSSAQHSFYGFSWIRGSKR